MSPKPCHCISRRLLPFPHFRNFTRLFFEFTFVKRIRLFFDFFEPFDESGLEFVSSSKTSSSADGLRSKSLVKL